ncbi:hypothetical protein AALP_AA6G269900 [Arabis alpina]|uniref:PI-PLC Y-box domain-containing protein n=1 Tax=Arabis alpina TaxID=50452 RepID=A0A087GRZ1_ARAAL|nr:hypothetical protein AALP_AA6G269900 [Arabis alpina]
MFGRNGGCGYVKKPYSLLNASPSGVFCPIVDTVVKKTLKVKVYMGDGWLVDIKKRIGGLSKPDLYVMDYENKGEEQQRMDTYLGRGIYIPIDLSCSCFALYSSLQP